MVLDLRVLHLEGKFIDSHTEWSLRRKTLKTGLHWHISREGVVQIKGESFCIKIRIKGLFNQASNKTTLTSGRLHFLIVPLPLSFGDTNTCKLPQLLPIGLDQLKSLGKDTLQLNDLFTGSARGSWFSVILTYCIRWGGHYWYNCFESFLLI